MSKKRANGEGSIRKRKDGRWEGRYTAGYDKDGKVITKNVLGKTQAEVKEKLKTAIEESQKLDPTRTGQYTVQTWVTLWYEVFIKPQIRPNTKQFYRNCMENHLFPALGDCPLEKLSPACRRYQKTTGRRISFEYSMVNGVNDSPQMAKKLADLIRGMGAHVNLIPINPVDGSPYSATDEANVRRFQKMLEDLGVNATIRRRLGTDISAACGQLRREDAKQAEQATRQTTSERTNAQ